MTSAEKETLEQRRDRLNKESVALRAQIKKKRVRLKKVVAALKKANAAIRGKMGRGIDVSEHQGLVAWHMVEKSGERWTGIKATEGVDFVDDGFRRNLKAATAEGLRCAPYHFARPDTGGAADAAAEARHFVKTVNDAAGIGFIHPQDWIKGKPGVIGVLDFEHEPFSAAWAKAWAVEFTRLTGTKPVIYGFGASLNPIAAVIETHFAWVWFAAFVSDWRPFCVDSLEGNVKAWQYTSSGSVPGVSGNVDRNRWLG